MTIGAFARASGLSPRALRLDDEPGPRARRASARHRSRRELAAFLVGYLQERNRPCPMQPDR